MTEDTPNWVIIGPGPDPRKLKCRKCGSSWFFHEDELRPDWKTFLCRNCKPPPKKRNHLRRIK